jgi:hypothetical protein
MVSGGRLSVCVGCDLLALKGSVQNPLLFSHMSNACSIRSCF